MEANVLGSLGPISAIAYELEKLEVFKCDVDLAPTSPRKI